LFKINMLKKKKNNRPEELTTVLTERRIEKEATY
jgi:hypothetical protein